MTDTQRPNLLYIHTDQHNPYVTGCYGDPLVQTPNLDKLAQSGVMFTNTYCNSPICVPSRMSMLTGQHPYQNEVWTNEHVLDSGIPTLAHSMGAAGYHPVLIGRMHSIGPDQLHGYSERLIGDHSPNYIGGANPDRGVLNGTAGPDRISLKNSGAGQSGYQVHDEYVTAATVNYLNQLGAQKRWQNSLEPFSLTVGFMLPHPPYVARQADYALYREQMTLPRKNRALDEENHPFIRQWREHTGATDVSEDEILRARTAYWGLVTRFDAMIGEIIDALHANGLADNTLIVYTSDHGDMVGEHGLWWKHVFYEESVKVPLIISWPGQIAGNQRSERVVSALDVNATILDALGAPKLPNSPGRSLLDLLHGNGDWEDIAFSEYCSDQFAPVPADECFLRMIRKDEWKLVYYHGYEPQLFNLKDDPDELTNRASDPACKSILDALTERVLAEWNPDAIRSKMARKRADTDILRQWAQQTQPPDSIRWDYRPEMNRLEN
ncbi:MAG: sulfatase [Anaerolineaceae bacterium]|nr:sulfatase [Anaerolineaceae bacterium]